MSETGIIGIIGAYTKKQLYLREASANVWELYDVSDQVSLLQFDKVNQQLNSPNYPYYHKGVKVAEYNSTDDKVHCEKDIYSDALGVSLGAHATRHNRGQPDAIDWASISKYITASATINAGASGSPNYSTVLTVDTNYFNMLPLTIKITPSGLGTGESLTIYVDAVLDDGSTVTLATVSNVTSAQTINIAWLDFTAVGNGRQIRSIKIGVESNKTSTSASATVDIAAIEF